MESYPSAVEGALLRLIEEALIGNDIAIVDDLHLVARASQRDRSPHTYILDAALTAILAEAYVRKKKLVFGVEEDETPWPLRLRAYFWKIGELTAEDYAAVCRVYLNPAAADVLDYPAIHRFAPKLNLDQIENACHGVGRRDAVDTAGFIEYLRAKNMVSNVKVVARHGLKEAIPGPSRLKVTEGIS